MLNTEVAEVLNAPGKVYEISEKTNYNIALTSEEKEVAEVLDAFAKKVGETGCDPEHQIAQYVTRTIQDELYNAPDELLDSMFDRGTVGEFDDYEAKKVVKNTRIVHDAAKGGNVPRSYLNFETLKPTWANKQVETDLSYVDLRRNGFKSVANLTTFMTEALQNKMFYDILNAVDAAITGGDQLIAVTGADPTMEAVDKLTLYLNEYSDGSAPFTVSLMKYAQKMRRMTGYAQYMSDSMKNDFNRYGLVKNYDGVAITAISSAKRLGDGSLLVPEKKLFGFAGKIGNLDMEGEVHTYQDEDNQHERIHLMVKDFTYGYCIHHIERIAKMTFSA